MESPTTNKPVIGLIGGIGAGKSTVADEFVRLGCVKIDADRIGHALLAETDVQAEIRERWGEAVFGPDDGVDRVALGAVVFRDAEALAALSAILHPRIGGEIAERVARAQREPDVAGIVVDAAVLLEAGWDAMCTHVVFVQAPAERRVQRVCDQRGWASDDWQGREKMQISLDKKASQSDYTIDNSSSASHLREQVRRALEQFS